MNEHNKKRAKRRPVEGAPQAIRIRGISEDEGQKEFGVIFRTESCDNCVAVKPLPRLTVEKPFGDFNR